MWLFKVLLALDLADLEELVARVLPAFLTGDDGLQELLDLAIITPPFRIDKFIISR